MEFMRWLEFFFILVQVGKNSRYNVYDDEMIGSFKRKLFTITLIYFVDDNVSLQVYFIVYETYKMFFNKFRICVNDVLFLMLYWLGLGLLAVFH